jgi:hypothetical protein
MYFSGPRNYRIAGRFSGELNLAVWQTDQPTAKLPIFAHAMAIAYRELIWWVWSLGSSNYRLGNYSWTTHRSLESLNCYCIPIFQGSLSISCRKWKWALADDWSSNILENYALVCSLIRWKWYSCSTPLPLDVNNAISRTHTRGSEESVCFSFW